MTYRDRREAKADRLRDWADKREVKADAAEARARQISDMIPFGQPVLVGHHSEGRHRRDLGRIESGWRASMENGAKARDMRSRADNIEAAAEHAIYSDDPDAIERLRERIAALESQRTEMKAENAAFRKAHAAQLKAMGPYDRDHAMPHRGYVLTNLSGNIARQRKRLTELAGQ